MARLRWWVFFESLWDDEIPALLNTHMPPELKGQQRLAFAKNKRRAADLVKTLFPTDEEPDGKS